jgi:predicted transcriptional regulator
MSWLNLLHDATKEAETPRSFILWSGICSIAAVVSPNVWLNKAGKYHLSPNIYCLLVAKSGLGKSLPIFMAKKLVTMVGNTRVISGRSTIQKIIMDLSKSETDEKTGIAKFKDARGFIVSGEFSVSMQSDTDLFTILTDIYDTHANADGWVNSTKAGGAEYLKAPCVTLFSGSSPEHFEEFVPKVNIAGGFIGRTLLIYEEKRWRLNPLVDEEEADIDFDKLACHLKKLKELSGGFKWSPEAKKSYVEWYEDFRPRDHDDKTGTAERFPDHILKVAMCLSLSKGTELIIRNEDLQEALKLCMKLKHSVKVLTSSSGKSNMAAQTRSALEIILKAPDGRISREYLLQKGFGDFNSSELDQIVETLIQSDFIKQIGTKEIVYQMSAKGKKIWEDAKEKA